MQEDEARKAQGKLKIFFGAAPGVGKTHTMLEAARARRAEGLDVVVGWVETHGRKETEALLEGLEVMPRRQLSYRGTRLEEFDLEAALDRRPTLILVDELRETYLIEILCPVRGVGIPHKICGFCRGFTYDALVWRETCGCTAEFEFREKTSCVF